MSLTHPSMVLSVFIRTLGGSNALVGLLPAIRFGGWFLPQFLVDRLTPSRPNWRVPRCCSSRIQNSSATWWRGYC